MCAHGITRCVLGKDAGGHEGALVLCSLCLESGLETATCNWDQVLVKWIECFKNCFFLNVFSYCIDYLDKQLFSFAALFFIASCPCCEGNSESHICPASDFISVFKDDVVSCVNVEIGFRVTSEAVRETHTSF